MPDRMTLRGYLHLVEAARAGVPSLPALDETRFPQKPPADVLAKAAADGFDASKLWYHGTRKRFDDFLLPKKRGIDELGRGVYLTSEKWLANTWARERGVICTCVVRRGPLFDFDKLNDPSTIDLLRQGYRQAAAKEWSPTEPLSTKELDELFTYVFQQERGRERLITYCLSAAGFIGGYKIDSQIEGQIVVFRPDDVRIVARQGGRAWMSSNEDVSGRPLKRRNRRL